MLIGFKYIEDAGMKLAMVSILAMMVIITANTIGRYLLQDSLTWSIPVIEMYIMGGIIFLSAAKVQKIGGNVSTTAFVRYIPNNVRRYSLIISYIITNVFVLGIIFGTTRAAIGRWQAGATTAGVVQLPTAYSWFIVSIGLSILFIRIMFEIYGLATSDNPFEDPEEDLAGENSIMDGV